MRMSYLQYLQSFWFLLSWSSQLGFRTAQYTVGEILIPVENTKSEPVSHREDLVRILLVWCRWWDSNPHGGLAQRILSPSRLPFHHTGFWKTPQKNLRRLWSWMRDSNSRPHDYESGALPAELIQHFLRKLSYITTRELFRQLFSFSPNPAGQGRVIDIFAQWDRVRGYITDRIMEAWRKVIDSFNRVFDRRLSQIQPNCRILQLNFPNKRDGRLQICVIFRFP